MLGIKDCLFIAKFLAELSISYKAKIQEELKSDFNENAYSEAVTETLRAFCAEDARQHGRLLALRNRLSKLKSNNMLEIEQLTCMYAKDIAIVR